MCGRRREGLEGMECLPQPLAVTGSTSLKSEEGVRSTRTYTRQIKGIVARRYVPTNGNVSTALGQRLCASSKHELRADFPAESENVQAFSTIHNYILRSTTTM